MKRDYAKKNYAKTGGTTKPCLRPTFIIAILLALVILLGGIGMGFYYQYRLNTPLFQRMSHLKAEWLAKGQPHLSNLKKKVEKVKQMANKEPEPIHFEFYDELPKMQVKVSEPTLETGAVKAKLGQVANSVRIADAEALERELEMQLEKSKRTR